MDTSHAPRDAGRPDEPGAPRTPLASTSGEEERVAHAQEVKAVLQRVVLDLTERFADRPHGDVRAALLTAIAEAGLPEQPRPWVESTTAEIAGGRALVLDPRFSAERAAGDDPEARPPS